MPSTHIILLPELCPTYPTLSNFIQLAAGPHPRALLPHHPLRRQRRTKREQSRNRRHRLVAHSLLHSPKARRKRARTKQAPEPDQQRRLPHRKKYRTSHPARKQSHSTRKATSHSSQSPHSPQEAQAQQTDKKRHSCPPRQ